MVRVHLLSILASLFHGQVCNESTINPGLHRFRTKTFQPETQYRIQVRKHDQPYVGLLADLLGKLEHIFQRGSMPQRALAGPLNHWPISNGIAKRHAQFDHVSAGAAGSKNDLARGGDVWVAAGHIGNQTWFMLKGKSAHSFKLSRKIPISLSPRPETFTITISDFFILGARLIHSATACDDSSAGIMPSVRARRVQASSASSSEAATYSARPESARAACSGPIEG